MTDRPILFSAPMINAIIEGRKTQTRRLFWPRKDVPPPHTITSTDGDYICRWHGGMRHDVEPRYSAGDRLWVREHWKTDRAYDDLAPSEMGGEEPLIYLADNAVERWGWKPDVLSRWGRHRQGMHMPRWTSRITLTVTDVRVQRLQEISEGDVYAEGVVSSDIFASGYAPFRMTFRDNSGRHWETPKLAFQNLWDSLNAKRAPWDSNPWIVAITFKSHLYNIDQMGVDQ